MKIFVAIKFGSDEFIVNRIEKMLKEKGHNPYFFIREEGYSQSISPTYIDMMKDVVRKIKESDALLIKFSDKSVGLGIEAGIAYMLGKPIYVVYEKGMVISNTLAGISTRMLEYNYISEISDVFD